MILDHHIDRYVARHVLAGILVVLIGLVSLFFIGDLVAGLDTVGRGNFDYTAALVFVLMRMPGRMYALLPAAALIGGLLGLGGLARSSELTAMRAAGAPVSRILGAALQAGALVIALGLVVGEWVAPASERLAHDWRTTALTGQTGGRAGGDGFWGRDGRRFLHFGEVLPNGRLRDVRMFEFDEAGKLASAWRARRASYPEGGETSADPAESGPKGDFWRLEEVEISRFFSVGVETRRVASILRRLPAGADRFDQLAARPGWLSLPEIVSYMRYLRENGLRTAHYDAALWSRIMAPFFIAAMLFIAVALVLGPLRQAGFGTRIVAGAALGIGFHILQKVVTQVGVVYGWSAPLAAAIPVGALGLLGWWWLRRAAA